MTSGTADELQEQSALGRYPDFPDRTLLGLAPRVLIADDQPQVRDTIALALGSEFDIVGMADDGRRAIELATQLCPDILLLDISMPVLNGIEAALRLKQVGSRAKVIFLTVHGDADFVDAALAAGALGYVLKSSLETDLVPAIWAALQDEVFVSPLIE